MRTLWTVLTPTLLTLAAVASGGPVGLIAPAVTPEGARPMRPAPRAVAAAIAADGRVSVVVEMTEPSAFEVWEAVRRELSAQGTGDVRVVAATAARAQVPRVDAALEAFARARASRGIAGDEVWRTRTVMSAVALRVDPAQVAAIRALPGVRAVRWIVPKSVANTTSVPFVGAPAAWAATGPNLTGTGVRVGVIDTGVDYMHVDFGGNGQYRADDTYTDPNWPKTAKVVGGWDFVGDDYDGSNSPKPDPDPQDCHGHGTHVAGTIAGYGVTLTDLVRYAGSYGPETRFGDLSIGPGVAPGAQLYALRIFGCSGQTAMVIPAVDWAIDPNGDGNPDDHLDAVNLSLGAPIGSADDPDAIAVDRATRAGVVVVAAAGNEGNGYFITGSPASADGAISVAAAGDPGVAGYNLHVNAPADLVGDAEAMPAAFGPRLGDQPVTADLVIATPNDGCGALTNGGQVSGRVAFVDRGTCNFTVKVKNAQLAGARAVVVANNKANERVTMAGDDPSITIPSASVTKEVGDEIRGWFGKATVNVTLTQESYADTIATFSSTAASSRGPRMGDLALKPDVTAPGLEIHSAEAGGGNTGATFSGTSMATPHVAGAVALLKQRHPDWTAAELKALVMNTADHDVYSLPNHAPPVCGPGRMGAGRIDVAAAAASDVVAFDADAPERVSVSFGLVEVQGKARRSRRVAVANNGSTAVTLEIGYLPLVVTPGVEVLFPGGDTVTVPAHGVVAFEVQLAADAAGMQHAWDRDVPAAVNGQPLFTLPEHGGLITLTPPSGPVLRVPLHAVARATAAMHAVASFDAVSADKVTLLLSGTGVETGTAYPADVVSLVSALELQYRAAATVASELGISAVGIATNYPAVKAQGGTLKDAEVYFGIATWRDWSTPAQMRVRVVIVDANGKDVYEVNTDDSGLAVGQFATRACAVNTSQCSSFYYLNRPPDERDTALFPSNVMVLRVPASAIGLGDFTTRFTYRVETYAFSSDQVADRTPALGFDPTRPGILWGGRDYAGRSVGQPLYLDLPGRTIPLEISRGDLAANKSTGVLLLHHHNARGDRDEVVGLSPTTPRRRLRGAGGGT